MKADFFCNRCFKHLPIKELGAKGKIHNMRYCKLCTAIADKRRATAATAATMAKRKYASVLANKHKKAA